MNYFPSLHHNPLAQYRKKERKKNEYRRAINWLANNEDLFEGVERSSNLASILLTSYMFQTPASKVAKDAVNRRLFLDRATEE